MAEKKAISSTANQDAKQLAITIYHFLLEERDKKTHLTKMGKRKLDRAADCLEKVYNIKFTDYVLQKSLYTLEGIFTIGYHPVPVKDRISADGHKRKGNEYMEVKLYKLAETEFTKALSLDPRNAIYFCNRAASRMRQGSYVSAITDCNRSLELDRHYAKAYSWLGLAHVLMDHPARGVRCFRKALRIEPDNQVCQANMDLINIRLNRMTFKVLEPLHWCRRNIIHMASNVANKQVSFKRNNAGDDGQESERKNTSLEKYALGTLD